MGILDKSVKLGILGVLLLSSLGAIFLPGSQPGQGRVMDSPSNCGCHSAYNQAIEPMFNWRGSMMSQAARDPLFFAALDIANYDVPEIGEFCLRCHSPNGWRNNRVSAPTGHTGSLMTGLDYEGVFCDFCHGLVDPLSTEGRSLVEPDVTTYGMGQFVLSNTTERRGPYNDATATHTWQYSAFHRSGNFCGVCHDVSNPANCPPGDPYNTQQCFPVERTFSEWNNSIYATIGEAGNCQSCHMKNAVGKAAKQGNVRTFLPVHDLVGGNVWAPQAVAFMYPADVDIAALSVGQQEVRTLLQSAAVIDLFDRTDLNPYMAEVKITNYSGHKLPTGYPEGRRVWINVVGLNSLGQNVWESGAYNNSTAYLSHDSQVKIYESEPGIMGPTGCEPSFHFVLNDCIASDNRIPPQGFTNAAFTAVRAEPVNYTYADGQYWDNTPYTLPSNVVKIKVNLYYQTASKEYVEFLSSAPGSGQRGLDLLTVWNATGKSAPVLIAASSVRIDNDADGMGNAWESANSLNPDNPADAVTDADEDGFNNVTEYQFETDPFNPADTPGCTIGTPVGSNIVVSCGNITLTFPQITSAGLTTITTSSTGSALPANLRPGNPPVYFNISTTATYVGSVTVAIRYVGIQYGSYTTLELLNRTTGWLNITTVLDAINQIITGQTNSLSEFAVLAYDGPAASPSPLFQPDENMTYLGDTNGDYGIGGVDLDNMNLYLQTNDAPYDTMQPVNTDQFWNTSDINGDQGVGGVDLDEINRFLATNSIATVLTNWNIAAGTLPATTANAPVTIDFQLGVQADTIYGQMGRPGMNVELTIDASSPLTDLDVSLIGRPCASGLPNCVVSTGISDWTSIENLDPTVALTENLASGNSFGFSAETNGTLILRARIIAQPSLNIDNGSGGDIIDTFTVTIGN